MSISEDEQPRRIIVRRTGFLAWEAEWAKERSIAEPGPRSTDWISPWGAAARLKIRHRKAVRAKLRRENRAVFVETKYGARRRRKAEAVIEALANGGEPRVYR